MAFKRQWKKSPPKKGKSDSNRDEEKVQIGHNRFVSVGEFKGKVLIGIREYYQDSDGDWRPGKKGISLSVDQWTEMKKKMADIDELIKKEGGLFDDSESDESKGDDDEDKDSKKKKVKKEKEKEKEVKVKKEVKKEEETEESDEDSS